jgi:hypothetical protein
MCAVRMTCIVWPDAAVKKAVLKEASDKLQTNEILNILCLRRRTWRLVACNFPTAVCNPCFRYSLLVVYFVLDILYEV